MSTLAELSSPLAQMATQAEAVAQAPWPGLEGDAIPPHQRDAWRRVLRGAVSGEGIEEWVVEPMIRGLTHAGVADAEVLRFFRSQGADELRHRDLFAAYLAAYWDEPEKSGGTVIHKLLYDGLFQLIIKQSEKHPLRLLLPLLFYERAAGSLYMTRLIDCVPESAPALKTLLKTVRQDEARHVAGVGLTCRALVAAKPPDARERKRLQRICRLVYWDMDRTAWWKPGLAGYMRDLGLDAAAMRRDNDQILAEMIHLIEGRGEVAIDTLLFDLDGTLVDQFEPGSALEFGCRVVARCYDLAPPWRIVGAGRAAHRALKTHRSDVTNFEVMIATFSREAGVDEALVRERVDRFFGEDFAAMAWRFRPVPGAREAVALAEALGFTLVLATNPTVPLPTIHQRLAWAGLSHVRWAFVTHPANMTRSKPDVAYYDELLAHLGRAPDRCLMIGNDFRKDLAAMDAGIRAFLLDRPMSPKARRALSAYQPDHFGSYEDLQALIRTLDRERRAAA